jgi:hypothetical protein
LLMKIARNMLFVFACVTAAMSVLTAALTHALGWHGFCAGLGGACVLVKMGLT